MNTRPILQQIKASAGSGKTYTLSQNFIKLLAQSSDKTAQDLFYGSQTNYDMSEILAVTFTNSAAANMQSKIIEKLKKNALSIASGDELLLSPEFAQKALNKIFSTHNALNIRTIDSLLNLIVASSAINLNLNPDFQIKFNLEEVLDPYQDSFSEMARENFELAEQYKNTARSILDYGKHNSFIRGQKLRKQLSKQVEYLLTHDYHEFSSQTKIQNKLENINTKVLETANKIKEILEKEKLNVNKYFTNALYSIHAQNPSKNWKLESNMFKKEDFTQCQNKNSTSSSQAEKLYLDLKCYIEEAQTKGKILALANHYSSSINLALILKEALLASQNKDAFLLSSLLAQNANLALGESLINESICRMGNRLQHILIDEFQDTNKEQWQVIKLLALNLLAVGGSLTMIGDSKQAIYAWRGSESNLFEQALEDEEIKALEAEVILSNLGDNWRSSKHIVETNNAIFTQLASSQLANEILGTLVPENCPSHIFAKSSAILQNTYENASQRVIIDSQKAGEGYLEFQKIEAENAEDYDEKIAVILPQLVLELSQKHAWQDICILTRTNTELNNYASILLENGIPVISSGSLFLAEHPLIAQIVAYLSFLNNHQDKLAFRAILANKGQLFSSEFNEYTNELNTYFATHRSDNYLEEFQLEFPQIWEKYFDFFYKKSNLLSVYEYVNEIYAKWNVLKRHIESNAFLMRFLEIIYLAEKDNISDISSFLHYWTNQGTEEKAPLPENMQAVKIMTLHKAKGMEFEIVILPKCEDSVKKIDKLSYFELDDLKLLCPICKEMGDIYYEEYHKSAREVINLLYVAFTRPKSELYCLIPKINKANQKNLSSCLELLLDLERFQKQTSLYAYQDIYSLGKKTSFKKEQEKDNIFTPQSCYLENRLKSKIHQNQLVGYQITANRRGTFIHYCLENLYFGQNIANNIDHAISKSLQRFMIHQDFKDDFVSSVRKCLLWFTSLQEAKFWLENGYREQIMFDELGKKYKADLVVKLADHYLVLDFKTGQEDLSYNSQLLKYAQIIQEFKKMPCQAKLIYLDLEKIVEA